MAAWRIAALGIGVAALLQWLTAGRPVVGEGKEL
jgi:hypothetical protein